MIPELLKESGIEEFATPIDELLAKLVAAFLLGCVVAAIHHYTSGRRGAREDRAFLATLILMALLIALVTLVIGNSLARAFSLVGSLAIVRFRTVLDDTRDTAFVIYAVAAGMSAGTGYVLAPLVCAPFVFFTAWLLRPQNTAARTGKGRLVVRLGAGVTPDERMQALLQQTLGNHRLIGLETARGGSAVDATYAVKMPTPDRVFNFLAELGKLDGVQNVELKAE